MTSTKRKRVWITKVAAGVGSLWAVLLGMPGEAGAIPVFARKYATSCVTCHATFPKLNAFGEAFRRSGYRFPAGEDEDATEQEPVELGHEAHKKVFPKVVWPATLPGNAPVSFQLASWITYKPEAETKASFTQVGGSFGLNVAGTIGERFSVWAGATVQGATGSDGSEASIEPERIFAVIRLFRDHPTMNLRVGRIEPGLVPFSMHRTLGIAPWYTTTPVRNNTFTLEPNQLGLELTGVLAGGRLGYVVGAVEGDVNTEKDAYARLEYKIGGMRLDGIGGATSSSPWRDDSVKIGAFGYLGFATLGDDKTSQSDRFFIVGGDVNAYFKDFNLMAAFTFAQNQRPDFSDPTASFNTWHIFAQVDYVAFPWLVPLARYEHRSVAGAGSDRMMAGVYALIRPNVRAQALAVMEIPAGGHFDLTQVLAGLNMAL